MELCDICYDFISPEDIERKGRYVMHKQCVAECKNNVSFGGHILTRLPMGFEYNQNSCFLDSLVYLYLTADCEVFKRILTTNVERLDYSKVPIFDCESNSVFAGKPKQYFVKYFHEMAGKIQAQLLSYVKEMNDSKHSNPQCRRLREEVALCLRSVIGDDGLVILTKNEQELTKLVLLPILVRLIPSITFEQAVFYGKRLKRFITESQNLGKSLNNTATVSEIFEATFFQRPEGFKHSIPPSAKYQLVEYFQRKMIELGRGEQFQVGMLHHFFSSLFPVGLRPSFKTKDNQTLRSASDLMIEPFLLPHDTSSYDLPSLASNQLLVFSNDSKYPILGQKGFHPSPFDPTFIYEVDRPLEERMTLAGETFSLVGVIVHLNEYHFTCYVRYKREWFYYNDMDTPRTISFNPKIHSLFNKHRIPNTRRDGFDDAVPVLFFYSRTDVLIHK